MERGQNKTRCLTKYVAGTSSEQKKAFSVALCPSCNVKMSNLSSTHNSAAASCKSEI